MIVAGLELMRTTSRPSFISALHACVPVIELARLPDHNWSGAEDYDFFEPLNSRHLQPQFRFIRVHIADSEMAILFMLLFHLEKSLDQFFPRFRVLGFRLLF